MIRLLYEKHGTQWSLALMEMSAGVRKLLQVPHFNPTSSDPKRQHLSDIMTVLAATGLDGGAMEELYIGSRHEVRFEIKPSRTHKPKKVEAAATARNLTPNEVHTELLLNDSEYLAQTRLRAESQSRLSTEEDSRNWLKHTQARLTAPGLLYSCDPDKK
jgi:hypothetical protein